MCVCGWDVGRAVCACLGRNREFAWRRLIGRMTRTRRAQCILLLDSAMALSGLGEAVKRGIGGYRHREIRLLAKNHLGEG